MSARTQLGHLINDGVTYDIIGERKNGSFRSALRKFGFTKSQIDRVLPDLDCDRDVIITERGHKHHLRAL